MKNLFFIVIIFASFSSCKKWIACNKGSEIKDRTYLTDVTTLKEFPEIYDTLLKYPQLRVWGILNHKYAIGFQSAVFYNGIYVLGSDYFLAKDPGNDSLMQRGDHMPKNIDVPVIPTVPLENAIDLAKNNTVKSKECVMYRLAILNLNSGNSTQPDYRLVWQILIGCNMVTLDANTGQIYTVANACVC